MFCSQTEATANDNWSGAILSAPAGVPMYIDYVKVYQQFGVNISEQANNNETLYVYPNPTTDYIIANQVVKSVKVYNLLGELVLNAENTDKVNVSELNKGIYIVNLIAENGVSKSQRIIKE